MAVKMHKELRVKCDDSFKLTKISSQRHLKKILGIGLNNFNQMIFKRCVDEEHTGLLAGSSLFFLRKLGDKGRSSWVRG